MALFQTSEPEDNNDINQHQYLGTIFAPFNYPLVPIPDCNLKPCVLKMTTIGNTFRSDGNSGLIVYTPNSPYVQCTRYRYVNNRFIFESVITPDEDLSLNYTWYRNCSSGIMLKSSTVSAGNFTVSGSVNVVCVQQLPDINALTFDTLIAYRQDEYGVRVQVPIQDGVACITPVDESHEYNTWDTPSAMSLDQAASSTTTISGDITFANNSDNMLMATGKLINNFGTTKTTVHVDISRLPNGIDISGAWNFYLEASYDDQTVVRTTHYYQQLTSFAGYPHQQQTVQFDSFWRSDRPIIKMALGVYVGFVSAPPAMAVHIEGHMSVANLTINKRGVQGPAFLIAWSGVDINNQIVVSSVQNYQVVPNAELYRNVKTSVPSTSSFSDVADYIAAKKHLLNFRTVYTLPEYKDSLKLTQRIVAEVPRLIATGHAMDAKTLLRYLRKAASALAPTAGYVAGSMLGAPGPGLAIGSAVADFIAPKKGYACDRNCRVGYASDASSMQQMVAAMLAEQLNPIRAQLEEVSGKLKATEAENARLKAENERLMQEKKSGVAIYKRAPVTALHKKISDLKWNDATNLVSYLNDKSQSNRRVQCLNGLKLYGEYNSAYFVYMEVDSNGQLQSHFGMIIASDTAFSYQDPINGVDWINPIYKDHNGINFDDRFSQLPQHWPDGYERARAYRYVTFVGPNMKIEGTSWHFSYYIAMSGTPNNKMAFTGSIEAEPTQVEEKLTYCLRGGYVLCVYSEKSNIGGSLKFSTVEPNLVSNYDQMFVRILCHQQLYNAVSATERAALANLPDTAPIKKYAKPAEAHRAKLGTRISYVGGDSVKVAVRGQTMIIDVMKLYAYIKSLGLQGSWVAHINKCESKMKNGVLTHEQRVVAIYNTLTPIVESVPQCAAIYLVTRGIASVDDTPRAIELPTGGVGVGGVGVGALEPIPSTTDRPRFSPTSTTTTTTSTTPPPPPPRAQKAHVDDKTVRELVMSAYQVEGSPEFMGKTIAEMPTREAIHAAYQAAAEVIDRIQLPKIMSKAATEYFSGLEGGTVFTTDTTFA